MEKIDNCPVCKKADLAPFVTCKDYTVTGEEFTIVACKHCDFKFTNPRPESFNISKYYKSENYISHSSSNKGLVNKLYQTARKYTLSQKLKLINSLSAQKSLLDIGCGTGHFLEICQQNGWTISGVEPDSDTRKAASERCKTDILPESALSQMKPGSFQVITLWHVLEHVHQLDNRMTELKRLLAPEGTLIIAVPNCTSYDAAHYGKFWGAYDVPRHLYHFSPKNIEQLAQLNGFKLTKILPMKLDAFYVSMLSEKYKNGSLFMGVINGLISNLKAGKTQWSSQIYLLNHQN